MQYEIDPINEPYIPGKQRLNSTTYICWTLCLNWVFYNPNEEKSFFWTVSHCSLEEGPWGRNIHKLHSKPVGVGGQQWFTEASGQQLWKYSL